MIILSFWDRAKASPTIMLSKVSIKSKFSKKLPRVYFNNYCFLTGKLSFLPGMIVPCLSLHVSNLLYLGLSGDLNCQDWYWSFLFVHMFLSTCISTFFVDLPFVIVCTEKLVGFWISSIKKLQVRRWCSLKTFSNV